VDKLSTEMIKYALNDVKIQFLMLLNNCWQSKGTSQKTRKKHILFQYSKKETGHNVKITVE
jgi:hypothetical protein